MNKFNFKFVQKLVSVITYIGLMIVLLFDVFSHPEIGQDTQHFMSWWALFLVLDMWFFGGRPGHEKKDNS